MRNFDIEVFSVEKKENVINGRFEYEPDTTALDILRSLGMEIKDNETKCTIFEEGCKKTFFVIDRNGFRFIVTIRA